MKICIDAGHNYSRYDTGAEGNGLREQDVTFEIADILKDYLHSVGISTVMTRPTLETNLGYDEDSSLDQRCRIANNSNCDYFISIHCNSFADPKANGTEVLISGKGGEAEKLAEKVQKSIVKNLGTQDRGIKVYSGKVLRNTKMPAILVETAFLSNPNDAELFKNRYNEFAIAIFWGVCEYLGIETQTNPNNAVKELETVNDIVWELNYRGIISNPELWLSKLEADKNSYWLARKCINYIRGM